jgi:hypothetical protein
LHLISTIDRLLHIQLRLMLQKKHYHIEYCDSANTKPETQIKQ